jgi:hypothetical protein
MMANPLQLKNGIRARLPEVMLDKVKDVCREDKISLSAFVRKALEEQIAVRESNLTSV